MAPATPRPGRPGRPDVPSDSSDLTEPTAWSEPSVWSAAGARAGPTAFSSWRTTPCRTGPVPPHRFAHRPSARVANTTYRLPVCMPSSPHEAPLTALRTSADGPT